MAFSELAYAGYDSGPADAFQSQYTRAQKNRTAAFLFTFFLGGFGAHRSYLGHIGLGVLYAVLFWTFIPAIVSLVELFDTRSGLSIQRELGSGIVGPREDARAGSPENIVSRSATTSTAEEYRSRHVLSRGGHERLTVSVRCIRSGDRSAALIATTSVRN
jgi:TM2 domain-containing protein